MLDNLKKICVMQLAVGLVFVDYVWKWKSLKLCPTLCPVVHGILQVRILEWVAFPFFRGSSQPRDQTQVSTLQVDSLPAEAPGKPKNTGVGTLSLL